MTGQPSLILKKNYQSSGPSMTAGSWTLTPCTDLISEKAYLHFRLQSKICTLFPTSLFTFRSEAAAEVAPAICPPIAELTKEGDCIEFLTPFYQPVNVEQVTSDDLEALFRLLIPALSRFEQYRFTPFGITPRTFGRNAKDTFALLPNAYIFPLPLPDNEPSKRSGQASKFVPQEVASEWMLRRSASPFSDGISLLASLLGQLGATEASADAPGIVSGDRGFQQRLLEILAQIKNSKIDALAKCYEILFGESLPAAIAPFPTGASDDAFEDAIDRVASTVARRASEAGGITLLRGDPFGGKTTSMTRIFTKLQATGQPRTTILDEWELFCKALNHANHHHRLPGGIILIDDIDEKGLIYSEAGREMEEWDDAENRHFILSADRIHTSEETKEFLNRMRRKLGNRFHECHVAGIGGKEEPSGSTLSYETEYEQWGQDRLKEYLSHVIHLLSPEARVRVGSPLESRIETIMSLLNEEERQLLEFLTVTRFAIPQEITLSLFPETFKGLSKSIHRLSALELIAFDYKYFHQRHRFGLFLSIKSRTIGRFIRNSLPKARRKNLSRTAVALFEESGIFPSFHFLYHLLEGEEHLQAARYCASLMKKQKGTPHPRYLTYYLKRLDDRDIFATLPFNEHILIRRELSARLLRFGDSPEARRLLERCMDLLETVDPEKQLKHAPLVMSTCCTLADLLERSGEYKKALELLLDTKSSLRKFLSLPDQAQLMNDIGWLQYRLGDYEKSMESCKLSLTSLDTSQHPLLVAQAFNIMGVVHFNRSWYDEAISYYERSAELRKREGDESGLSGCYNNLGLVYQTKGEHEKALEYYEKSLEIKVKQNNEAGIAVGNLNLAMLHLEMDDLDEAEARCLASLKISKKLKNAKFTAEILYTLGDIDLSREKYKDAENNYKESLDLSRSIGTINEELGALRRLSRLYLILERHEESEKTADEATTLARRIESKLESAILDTIWGDLKSTQKRIKEALEHYEKAAVAFTTLAKHRLAASALAKIGRIHADSGNTLQAKQIMDRAHDSLRSAKVHTVPPELLELQRELAARPAKADYTEQTTGRLLTALYELSSLSDVVTDRREFFKKILGITSVTMGAEKALLGLIKEPDTFVLYDDSGLETGMAEKGMSTLFSLTLLLGHLVESGTPDVADITPHLSISPEQRYISIPLKAMGEALGCLFIILPGGKPALSKEENTLYTSIGRQIAGCLRLMLHLEEHILSEEVIENDIVAQKAEVKEKPTFENLIGESEEMKKVFAVLEKIKNTDVGVLILGESGTGKTELARAIHYNSKRKHNRFMEIHCSQIPYNLLESELFGHEKGAFTGAVSRKLGLCEVANGGTVFLDDVNSIPPGIQAKLLNFIESKRFRRLGGDKEDITSDVRIIAASNEDLEELCEEGRFREDLYFRLNILQIAIPPLRERPEDIIAIANLNLKQQCSEKGIPYKTLSPETIRLLQKAPWKGNVRELKNIIERIVLLSDDDVVTPESLPEDVLKDLSGTGAKGKRNLDSLVQEIIALSCYSEGDPLMPRMESLLAKYMVEFTGIKGNSAALLGISKPTLYSRLRNFERWSK